MIRLIRILGIILIALGAIVIIAWLIEPIRDVLPHLWDAFRQLPITVQVGLGIALIGFVLLFSSIIWERLEDRKGEKDLLDDF